MRRTDRLFEILQMFRERGFLRAADMAERLEVSIRTIYRDLDTLMASGHPIEGERGIGYLLREPIFLPPLKLNSDEVVALRLGMDLVKRVADAPLSHSAASVLGKLTPTSTRSGLSVYTSPQVKVSHISALRNCIDRHESVRISYRSLDECQSQRTIRPLQLEIWDHVWTLTAWCETRDDFRTFRVDRIDNLLRTGERFPSEPDKSYDTYLEHFSMGDAR